ncbi:MAG: phosphoadenylyl-sulfate reductase [Mycolicibacterium sp.]|nr:phosphoadenylyl-sulfate reductase [Mycolicibacterium sp.]
MNATMTEDDLRALAIRGAADLDGATAAELLAWTDTHFAGRYVVAANMQDAVLIDLAAKVRPGVDVLFLDTGYHFAETIGTRDAVESVYGVNIVNVTPEYTVAEQDRLLGRDLFARDPERCCRLRKVEPLGRALGKYSAWVTGIRRVDSLTRADSPLISFDEGFKLVKVNPLAAWTDDDMHAYMETHRVLLNPLVDEGYPSIGCEPCTAKPAAGADPRSGRWQGLDKTECGLHL